MSVTLCQAIAKEEGFGVLFARATRNNNPGNINYGGFAQAHGADGIEVTGPHETARFAHFPSADVGFAAMKTLLSMHYYGLSLHDMIYKYAPPTDNNNTEAYLANLCKWTGATPGTSIMSIL